MFLVKLRLSFFHLSLVFRSQLQRSSSSRKVTFPGPKVFGKWFVIEGTRERFNGIGGLTRRGAI